MRNDTVGLEENRLLDVTSMEDYQSLHERHRIFPRVFENRNHRRILDISAGVGVVGRNIRDASYPAELICNDVSPTCLKVMQEAGLKTVSFDLDSPDAKYPYTEGHFDAVISLATIEHLINVEHFLMEIRRILNDKGYLYLSAPNYSGLTYLLPFLATGKTFHDPMDEISRYEFFAHVRYFTFGTLAELVQSMGYSLDAVYLPVPQESSKYNALKSRSKLKAFVFRCAMTSIYKLFSPRWAAEPVLCFRKEALGSEGCTARVRKIVL
jgi:SAM-dependent methyltransferase